MGREAQIRALDGASRRRKRCVRSGQARRRRSCSRSMASASEGTSLRNEQWAGVVWNQHRGIGIEGGLKKKCGRRTVSRGRRFLGHVRKSTSPQGAEEGGFCDMLKSEREAAPPVHETITLWNADGSSRPRPRSNGPDRRVTRRRQQGVSGAAFWKLTAMKMGWGSCIFCHKITLSAWLMKVGRSPAFFRRAGPRERVILFVMMRTLLPNR